MKQTTQNATLSITSAILAGDTLREALTFTRTLFFKLSRAEWQRVTNWAQSEYSTGVK